MHRLHKLLGGEHHLDFVSRTLRDFASAQQAAAVGAAHITCSDECERECVESFQHWFADQLLPELKSRSKAPFRTANLGGRYEWGAVRIAEQHYATPATRDSFKLMVVKINSHVSVEEIAGKSVYGQMDRYESPSVFCAWIDALLKNDPRPSFNDMRTLFASEGVDRLAMLQDPACVDLETNRLLGAVVSARLQARQAIVDIQDYQGTTPTIYLVTPAVTLNRKQRDTELFLGYYLADIRGGEPTVEYHGLGDDPSQYRLSQRHGMLQIEDDHLGQKRQARDHRHEVFESWMQRREPIKLDDPRLTEITELRKLQKHRNSRFSHEVLKTLLWVLLDVSPIPTSVILFGKGLTSIHNLFHAHQLASGQQNKRQARRMVEEFIEQVDGLPPEKAAGAVELLLDHLHPDQ